MVDIKKKIHIGILEMFMKTDIQNYLPLEFHPSLYFAFPQSGHKTKARMGYSCPFENNCKY